MTVFPVRAANRAILPVLWRDPYMLAVAFIAAGYVASARRTSSTALVNICTTWNQSTVIAA